jgi:uncharacterized SAM-dependent methyltransferase
MEEIERPYLDGLKTVLNRRKYGEAALVLFLGSTIGNFDRAGAQEFLIQLGEHLLPGDTLLLGTDLVKPVDQMLAAYNDPLGVTAAFNMNLLARINRELGGDFVLANFRHRAIYNRGHRRIEMHLRSRCSQRVTIREADLTVSLDPGETIWTESSHKYRLEEVREMGSRARFSCQTQWVDDEWPFAESLLAAQ